MAKETLQRGATAPARVRAASALFDEIASAAHEADVASYHLHGELIVDGEMGERITCELIRLRGVICRLGWMAALGSKACGTTSGRGSDASDWLLSPLALDSLRALEEDAATDEHEPAEDGTPVVPGTSGLRAV
jgi:hypothetical protein